MIAYVRRLTVEKKRWLDETTFRNGVALCQSIPGATAIQSTAYVGLKLRGLSGAAVCYTGFGLPAFILMMVMSALYVSFHSIPSVVSAFSGLQAIIVAIVANGVLSFGKVTLKMHQDILITFAAAIVFLGEINPFLVIVTAGLIGMLFYKTTSVPGTKPSFTVKLYSGKKLVIILVISGLFYLVLFFLDGQLFDLDAILSRIDIFAFGGGFSTIPLIYHEIVEVHSWLDSATLLNGIALGQVTPGPIVITATFIGYILRGPLGAVIASIAMFLPSFIILVAAAPYYERLRFSSYFNKATSGILCSFVGLLLSVTLRFAFAVPWDPVRMLLAIASFLALLWKIDILYVVIVATACAVLIL
jgi:chromate transporter